MSDIKPAGNVVYLVTTRSSDGDSETQRALGPAPDGVHPLPAGRYTMLHRDGTRGQSLILDHGVTGIEMRLADTETSAKAESPSPSEDDEGLHPR